MAVRRRRMLVGGPKPGGRMEDGVCRMEDGAWRREEGGWRVEDAG